jgi:hypothetical protein
LLHLLSIHATPELTSPRRLIPASAIENTSKNEKDAI